MSLSVDQIREVVTREVARFAESSMSTRALGAATEREAVTEITHKVAGFGALQPLLDDSGIEEIWINAPDRIFVARAGVAEATEIVMTEAEIRQIVERMLWQAGRRIDASMPFVDASLPDGSRLHVIIPEVTARHWAINIRKFTPTVRSLSDLVRAGSLTRQASEFLRMSVLAGLNIIVSGATQAGKTTMLNALLGQARSSERLITVEETRELNVEANDVVSLQCRAPNLEGHGEITLRRLISEALRMRPTRLVVGEVRGAECLDLLIALNSGLAGACSIHANSAREALSKMTALPLLAGGNVDAGFISGAVADCVDVVVHCALDRRGQRRVVEVCAVAADKGRPQSHAVFETVEGVLCATSSGLPDTGKFDRAGLNPDDVLVSRS